MNIHDWTAVEWGVLGNWILALATFMAAIVALWTSKQSRKPKVIVSVSYGFFVGGGNIDNKQHLIVTAVNAGIVPVTLTNTSFKLPNKKQMVFPTQQQGAIPKKLQPSESTEYYVELSLIASKLKEVGYKGRMKLHITFVDSLGNTYKQKIRIDPNSYL
ncbi:hypothetical protein ABXS71_02515 [Bacillus infantis]|uniref:hypothetical protein n=1 Tax=Bacillus infantis TaxID=324767 RepID=UPI00344FCE19